MKLGALEVVKKMIQTGILEPLDEEDVQADVSYDNRIMSSDVQPAPKRSILAERNFFGAKQEMKQMDIGALFGSAPSESPATLSWEDQTQRKKPGRKGRKFFFNKEKYDKFKQDNNFRLEF